MANDATFAQQLQALAAATATFADTADAQIKNTIITALGGASSVTEEQPSSGGSTPAATPTILWDINLNNYHGEDFKDCDIVDLDNFDYNAFSYLPSEVDGAIRINFIESGYIDVTFRFE